MASFRPCLRGAPRDLPFLWHAQTLRSGLNFTLQTDVGALDLLGEVTGLGVFADVQEFAVCYSVFGQEVLLLGLDGLERAKRAVGRPKDLLDLEEIAAIRRRQRLLLYGVSINLRHTTQHMRRSPALLHGRHGEYPQ